MVEVSPSNAAGYFHWPPVWIGDMPASEEKNILNEEVFRTSLPKGILAKVLRQGIFVLDFSRSLIGGVDPGIDWVKDVDTIRKAIYRRVAVLNAHLVCLYTALAEEQRMTQLPKMVVTPSNMLVYRTINDDGVIHPEAYVPAQMHYMRCADGIPKEFLSWKRERSATITMVALEKSFELLERILDHPSSDALDLVHLYARSCKAYQDHDFGLSLITAWTITEKLLDFFWKGYLESLNNTRSPIPGKGEFISGERKERLIGRDYTASMVTEILSLAGVIPPLLYEDLNKVRSARNGWIHNLNTIENEIASEAIFLAGDMLNLVYDLNFRVSTSSFLLL